jgi:WD40 repeat protein/tRNA A-37 threonylcarbamoyl transferase component Bud32
MGHVYLCEHKVMRRRVALKVLPATQAQDPAALERFRREARAVAALDHPNIVRAYDIDQDDKMHFLVMEYVDGDSLQELVEKEGPLDVGRACNYAYQTALGLQHAHENGLIHRDVKPANMLVDRQGAIKILDLGLARFFFDFRDNLTKEHQSETILGTADYLSPEQALDSHEVDIRSDIYSLGLTLYFLLKGKSPYDDESVAQKLLSHQTRTLDPLSKVRRDVPKALAAVVAKMSARAVEDRYQEPIEVARALEPWLPMTVAESDKDTRAGRSVKTAAQPSRQPEGPAKAERALSPVHPSAKLAEGPAPEAPANAITAEPAPRRAEDTSARLASAVRRVTKQGGFFSRPAALWGTVAAVSLLVIGAIVAGLALGLREKRTTSPPTTARATGPRQRPPVQQPPPEPQRAPDPHLTRVLEGHTKAVECLALSSDGRTLLSGGVDRTMRLWDLQTGECRRLFTRFKGTVWSVAFSPDARLGLTTSESSPIKIWDLNTGDEVRILSGHKKSTRCAAFSHDGRYVVSCSYDRTVRLWDAATGQELKCSEGMGKGAWWLTLSADDRYVFVADTDGVARMLETATLRLVREFDGHGGKDARRVALSLDGKRLLTCGFDGAVRLWEVESGRQLAHFDNAGHFGESCGFGPDGTTVFCTEGPSIENPGFLTDDQGVRFWDAVSRKPLYRFGGVPAKVHQGVLSSDGQYLAAGSGDKLIRVWRLPR